LSDSSLNIRATLLTLSCVTLTSISGFVAAQQSGVTLYGLLDLGFEYDHVRQSQIQGVSSPTTLDQTSFVMSNGVQSGSRWGLRGVESLGGGYQAEFVLEQGFNPAQGTISQGGLFFGRQSTLGLSSQRLGRIDLGRRINLASSYFLAIDPFEEGFGQANVGASFGSANTTRYNNLVLLQATPTRSLTLGAGYSFSTGLSAIYAGGQTCANTQSCSTESGGNAFVNNQNFRALTLGTQYKSGPLDVAIAYDRLYGDVTQNASAAEPSAWMIGVAYDFKTLRLSAAIGRANNGLINGQSSGTGSTAPSGLLTTSWVAGAVLFLPEVQASSYMLGVTAPLSQQINLLASWQMMQPQGLLEGNAQFKTQQIFSAALTQQISARTNLYTFLSYGQNYAMVSSADSFVAGVGIRLKF
jgi:predicted porin